VGQHKNFTFIKKVVSLNKNMSKQKQKFTETPRTSGPMKPNEKISSPDKPIIKESEKPKTK